MVSVRLCTTPREPLRQGQAGTERPRTSQDQGYAEDGVRVLWVLQATTLLSAPAHRVYYEGFTERNGDTLNTDTIRNDHQLAMAPPYYRFYLFTKGWTPFRFLRCPVTLVFTVLVVHAIRIINNFIKGLKLDRVEPEISESFYTNQTTGSLCDSDE